LALPAEIQQDFQAVEWEFGGKLNAIRHD
jgi:hypothetical protein